MKMTKYDPLADLPESDHVSGDTAEIISATIAWYDGKKAALEDMAGAKVLALRNPDTGEEETIDDPKILQGYRMGLHVAKTVMGEFPISIDD